MTPTARLRELLDERGVEHEGDERSMRWRDRYGISTKSVERYCKRAGADSRPAASKVD